ncbi:MAG: hypothetical protein IT581_02045 [Verrucomicrobiales bacterium]|nr:hypothetical protein [Verrucomicrobiales bacterium]
MNIFRTMFGLALLMAGSPAFSQSDSTFQREPNAEAAGLWIGEVTLREVGIPGTTDMAPTKQSADLRILLHVDQNGVVRLLKDVIVAARQSPSGNEPPFPYKESVVTRPAALASLPIVRDLYGSARGQRFSTVAYDFTDNDADPTDAALDLSGGLGQNHECVGTLTLDKNHPTNPFMHKFHPDHANEGAKAYVIRRTLTLQFLDTIRNVSGTEQLLGTYEEKITGLHRSTLTAKGTVRLTRVSTAALLN